jgi:hypothetical protein
VSEAVDQIQDEEQLTARDDTEVEPQDDGDPTEAAETQLDPEVVARRDAALAHVRKFGDPVLKTKARPVERFDDALRDEVRRMGLLMDDALGIGLAATQVGILHRLLVYRAVRRTTCSTREPGGRVVLQGGGDGRGGLPEPAIGAR